ncbi:hypothetical protein MGYG_02338 [Nannizzia gypsea CBS 118893]|uniref:Uncharacterized protein n=1 Tax=Arthroderma gypseum (strain ATCC MYA-4604 / CBS 118893) TaxID=535722 RepID=E4UR50_ARTGP|nr:hypothetical protein MGYG_02338 [Nannizzia gypsea CBS 118893]EFQ99325.1 hypothetical protein MGYG_02338 [Nannizzia gypsea CBS 118893]
MATTLLEYLTQPNPEVDHSRSLQGLPSKCDSKEEIHVVDWKDFTYATLISCYGDVLSAHVNYPLPEISPPVRNIELKIFDEDSLDHLLTRTVVPPVNESLRIAWEGYHPNYPGLAIDMTRGGRARRSQYDLPALDLRDESQNANSAPAPFINRCPGDTKLSSKWRSMTNKDKVHYYWPYAQMIKYCGDTWNVRYGAMILSGIANKRSPRNVAEQSSRSAGHDSPLFVPSSPPATRSSPQRQTHLRNISTTSATSAMSIDRSSGRPRQTSITSSLASLSMSDASEHIPGSEHMSSSDHMPSSQSYKDDGKGGEYRPVEMKSIPWDNSGKGKLTVKLALWWIHMMAAAPGCDTTIGPEYPPLDAWVLRNGVYHHNTTGLVSKNPPDNAMTISPRQASRGIMTPPRQRQSSGSPPAEHLSSPNQPSPQPPTREEIARIRWVPEQSRWQYRTRSGSGGFIRDRVPIPGGDGVSCYYIRRTPEGNAQWVRGISDEDDEGDESMGLPPAPSRDRRP